MKTSPVLKAGLVSLVITASLGFIANAFGAGGPLEDEIEASQRGEYTKVINIGQQLVQSYPNSDLAHYYLADAYYRTNQLRQAELEYKNCLRVTQNKTIQGYCQEFLNRVKGISLTDVAPPNSVSIKMDPVSKLHEQMHVEQSRETDEETKAILRLQQAADAKLKQIQDQLTEDMATVPDLQTPVYGARSEYRQYVRGESERSRRLQGDAQRATAAVKAQLQSDINHVKMTYSQHDAAVGAFSRGIESQLRPGTSDIQLTPHNLGMNVKNYENFAPSNPPPAIAAPPPMELRAKPGVLRLPPANQSNGP